VFIGADPGEHTVAFTATTPDGSTATLQLPARPATLRRQRSTSDLRLCIVFVVVVVVVVVVSGLIVDLSC